MKMLVQNESMKKLQIAANADFHSLIIAGSPGCGKTYLANQYSKLLNIKNVNYIESSISDVKNIMFDVYHQTDKMLFIIENLDTGLVQVSYALLKLMEEPPDSVYIIVTCRNIDKIPDTLISRSYVIHMQPMGTMELSKYMQDNYQNLYRLVIKYELMPCIKSISDIKQLNEYDESKIRYLSDLYLHLHNILTSKRLLRSTTVYSLSWKLTRFEDNSTIPVKLMFQILLCRFYNYPDICRIILDCVSDLESGRIAEYIVLQKFLFMLLNMYNS